MINRFPGKILIFGEYLVLDNHMGLASPLSSTYCSLHEHSAQAKGIMEDLSIPELMKDWIMYCKNHGLDFIDLKRWRNDAENTLAIDSNIPIGFGLGSSGALTACIYERFAVKTTERETTRVRLAQMESFFHGKSSGIDPWVSYSKQSWLFQGSALHAGDEDKIRTFTEQCVLVNSGIARNTKSLVERFQVERRKMKGWDEMVDLSNTLAQSFSLQQSNPLNIQDSMHRLSQIQRRDMSWLIPASIQGLWDEVLAKGNAMKLCGAGGGGYFLLHDPAKQCNDLITKHNLTARNL
ncbi:MAG TPA: hypothetical protein DCF84_02195 [Bacteroidetes bacterium]|nr:hypothetical protein [Bacteroidota bacterium]